VILLLFALSKTKAGSNLLNKVKLEQSGNLRRKRILKSFKIVEESKEKDEEELDVKSEDHLEDLWSRAVAVSEYGIGERFLGYSMSLPTRSPTKRPSEPTLSPVRSPNPTSNPTYTPTVSNVPTTEGPTADCLSGTTREEYLIGILSQITDPPLINDLATPQGKAFEWIVNGDPLDFDPCTYPTIEQRYGLAVFFYATEGASWTNNEQWLGAAGECTWFGVSCGDSEIRVQRLQLPLNSVSGTMPNEVSTLYEALRFDLFGNTIAGTLPSGLGNLTKLELLDLEENAFTGLIFSTEVLALTNLLNLRGSFNKFTGSIPVEIARLSKLEQLWFADNFITGSIPSEISDLSSLESIFGYRNTLSSTLPSAFGGFANLTQVRLYENRLEGTVPADLFRSSLLETIRLDNNELTGTIPRIIGDLGLVEDLRLFNNRFFGSIPSEIGNLLRLENLILNNNFFSGTLSDSLFQTNSTLRFIDLSNNRFISGTIPPSLFTLPFIRNIYLANCTLTGTIPQTYSTPPNLRDLFIDGNNLEGTVPEVAPGELTEFNEFLLQNNQITGTMPASVCSLRDDTIGSLEDLWSDCGSSPPEIVCECCTRCF